MNRARKGFSLRKCRIGVVGLGYVGLPLAVEFGKRYETIGFDIKPERVAELRGGRDSTLEVGRSDLKAASRLRYTSELSDLKRCDVLIVTVPTPIDGHNQPDLTPLVRASESRVACRARSRARGENGVTLVDSTWR